MKKNLLLTVALGLAVVGASSIAYSAILPTDVYLKYYDIDGILVSTAANEAVGALNHDQQSEYPLVIWDDTYSFIAKTDGLDDTSGWKQYEELNLFFNITTYASYESDVDLDEDGLKDKGGFFTVQWKGDDLPTYFDFVFGFGVGNAKTYDIAYYRFDDIYLSSDYQSADGTYEMKIINKGGNIQELSHLMTYGIKGETPPPAVPEPATMLLFGTGLAGLAAVARRRKN